MKRKPNLIIFSLTNEMSFVQLTIIPRRKNNNSCSSLGHTPTFSAHPLGCLLLSSACARCWDREVWEPEVPCARDLFVGAFCACALLSTVRLCCFSMHMLLLQLLLSHTASCLYSLRRKSVTPSIHAGAGYVVMANLQ